MPTAGILGWKRSKLWKPILHNSKSPETQQNAVSENIKNIWRKKPTRGAIGCPRGWGARPLPRGAPDGPPMPIFSYMRCFDLEKIIRRLSGPDAAVSRRNRGGNQSRAPAELFCRGYFPPGGGNRHRRHHQQLSHLGEGYLHQHLHQHHLLSNPSSSLVSNLCTQTSDWYLWVASSVDYSL